jgi:hypothetical protein
MRVFDQGSFFAVQVFESEVYQFIRRWPCSGLDGTHGITFTFDKANGDLVDCTAREHEDGAALAALSQDAQVYGALRLGVPV